MTDTRKVKLAMLYLASKQDWSIDIYQLIKLLSLADELHEVKWGETISERESQSIEDDLLSRIPNGETCLIDPREFIISDHRYDVTLEMIVDELSKSETDALDLAYDYLGYEK